MASAAPTSTSAAPAIDGQSRRDRARASALTSPIGASTRSTIPGNAGSP